MKKTFGIFALSALLANPAPAAPEEVSSTTISIGVVVSDLDKAVDFYTDVVGMIQTGGFEINGEFSKKSGLADGNSAQVKVLRLGDGANATQRKLMSFGDKAQPLQNDFVHSHTGMHYITLMVTDLSPVLKRIKERKIKLLGETPVPLGASSHFVLIQDPDGTFIELIGPMKTSP